MSQILNGGQQESFFRSFWHEECDEFGFWSDISDDIEDRFSGRAFSCDDVDFVVVDERVAKESDPVALANSTADAVGGFGDLVVKSKSVANLKSKYVKIIKNVNNLQLHIACFYRLQKAIKFHEN